MRQQILRKQSLKSNRVQFLFNLHALSQNKKGPNQLIFLIKKIKITLSKSSKISKRFHLSYLHFSLINNAKVAILICHNELQAPNRFRLAFLSGASSLTFKNLQMKASLQTRPNSKEDRRILLLKTIHSLTYWMDLAISIACQAKRSVVRMMLARPRLEVQRL